VNTFDALEHPICLSQPARLAASAWIEHVPFGMYLVAALRPRVLVELGTYRGVSYCAFCQAVKELMLDTRCYAVDTWEGDPHKGFYGPEILAELRRYHDPLYGAFSSLIRGQFKDVAQCFESGSVDLCHIDGYHQYEAVKDDYETWLPKMSERGIVVFHDTNVYERDFGVWQLWQTLQARYPHFEMIHGHGLGVLSVGSQIPTGLQPLFSATPEEALRIRRFFFHLGERLVLWKQLQTANETIERQEAALARQAAALAAQKEYQGRWEAVQRSRAYQLFQATAQFKRSLAQLRPAPRKS
jgi:methyltransferase family protein